MKKRDKLSFREEIKVLLRNTMNRLENKTLQDVIDYAKKYYLMDVRLRGNTISYALKYRTDKKGKSMAVRGSRLGARFTVAGITEYLKKKEKSRLEYERIKADIEQESGRYDDYAEWKEPSDMDKDVKCLVPKDRSMETGNKQASIVSDSVEKKSLEKKKLIQMLISAFMRALTGSVRKRIFVMTRRKCSMVLRLMNLIGSGRE